MSGYALFAQMGKPYNSCWQWNTYSGTQFAARASKWSPITQNDQDLRCLPEVFPAEYQVLNIQPVCRPQECSGCKQPGTCSGNIAVSGGNCPACRRDFMTLLNGYADRDITDISNPLI